MTIPGGDYAIEVRLGKHRRSFGTLLLAARQRQYHM
jgi:hypothetical protein